MNNTLINHENINKIDEEIILSLFKTKKIFELINLIPEIDLNIKKKILDYTHSYFSEYIMDTLIRECSDCYKFYYDCEEDDDELIYDFGHNHGYFYSNRDREFFYERMIYIDDKLRNKIIFFCENKDYQKLKIQKKQMMGDIKIDDLLHPNERHRHFHCLDSVLKYYMDKDDKIRKIFNE